MTYTKFFSGMLRICGAGLISAALILGLGGCQNAVTSTTESTSGSGSIARVAYSSSLKWSSWTGSGYTVYNNVWGSGAGYQSLWVNSYNNWGVWAAHL